MPSAEQPVTAALLPAGRPTGAAWLVGVAMLAALLVILPLLAVLANLLAPTGETWAHVAGRLVPRYLLNTVWLALGVGVLTTAVGVGAAWLVVFYRFPGVRLVEWALILPLAIPAYVLTYAYYDLLGFSGPVQSTIRAVTGLGPREYWFPNLASVGGAIFILAVAFYPYVYLAARTAFLLQSGSLLAAGRMLGCTQAGAFFRVALPLARPAIAVGVVLVLMETLADYGAVSLLGVQTFTTGIYRAWFSMGDRVAAAQLGAILLGFVLLLVLLERFFRRGRAFNPTAEHRFDDRHPLRGWQALGALGLCLVPLGLGFALPVGRLVWMTIDTRSGIGVARFVELISNTVSVAATAAAIAVAIGLVIAYATRLARSPLVPLAAAVAAMGYALPGPIIAIGTLVPLAAFDNALDGWLRASFGVSTGLLLTGSLAALVFAYLVRFLAVSIGHIEAGFARIRPSLDDAASVLGTSVWTRLWRIHMPILWPALGTAALITFVDVMKELPATLVLRPFDFDTLAVRVYNLARDERIAEAALPALVLVLVGLIPVYLLSRNIARGRRG